MNTLMEPENKAAIVSLTNEFIVTNPSVQHSSKW